MARCAALVAGVVVAGVVSAFGSPLAAQEPDTTRVPSGVRLGLIYQTSYRPELAVKPFDSPPAALDVARRAHEIIERDLGYSDRFEMADVPRTVAEGPVDYAVWNGLGVVYLVTGALEPTTDGGYRLRVLLHDVVYERVEELSAFELPAPTEPGFRMAVHGISDRIVRWTTGDPGMAASRVVFVRSRPGGGRDLMIVDSDGENLQRLAASEEMPGSPAFVHSPTWAPDGRRIAYAVGPVPHWRVIERELATGEERVVAERDGQESYHPAWAPDARHLAFSSSVAGGHRIYQVNAVQGCCLERVTTGSRDDMSPTYSPDGGMIAFNSNRLGQPHIYIQRLGGGQPTLLTPFVYGESGYYTSPDWSPTGTLIAFHGRSRGGFQVMVADARNPGATVRQLTSDGVSEDPSWAPDGRHVVFSGTRADGSGLYVLDTVTGRIRPLVLGGSYLVPDWSPTLAASSARIVGGR